MCDKKKTKRVGTYVLDKLQSICFKIILPPQKILNYLQRFAVIRPNIHIIKVVSYETNINVKLL